jgi:hypothetical protein
MVYNVAVIKVKFYLEQILIFRICLVVISSVDMFVAVLGTSGVHMMLQDLI